ncbi:RHTO0S23e01794g1_1 [Rhodotorula toruloides]|uniref:RHTO0S23e01794g1_1 n=1 Tax=Rhodotorula toruloides TaxID=5286 RepID=A0A061BME6_RHOTO|nr:RHTO0S23e01794g1_1 [Rhodotorula toruloides]
MADEVHDPRRPNQVASLVHSPLWRSVHLAAPPLIVPSLDAQQLHSHRRTRGTPLDSSPIIVQTVAEQRAGVMNNLHSPAARLSRDDQAWLRSRLEALVGRFQASVPRHAAANPVRDDAVRVALGRVTASLRSDVEVSRNRDDSWTIVGFLTWILMECKLQLRGDRPFDEDFLSRSSVSTSMHALGTATATTSRGSRSTMTMSAGTSRIWKPTLSGSSAAGRRFSTSTRSPNRSFCLSRGGTAELFEAGGVARDHRGG